MSEVGSTQGPGSSSASENVSAPPAPAAGTSPAGVGKPGGPTGAETADRLYTQSANQYLIGLKATYLDLLPSRDPSRAAVIWDEIQRILEKYPEGTPIHDDLYAWDDAYRCERLLVNLYDPARLDIELQRRILAAETTKLDYANFYSGLQAKPIPPKSTLEIPEVEFNRALLAKLIDDQQWHDTKRYLKRSYANDAQIRVFRVFSVALVLFILVMLVVFLSRDQLAIPAKSGRSTQSQATPPASSQEKPAEPATGGGTGGPIVAPTAGALEPPASKPEGASDAPPVQMQD